MANNIYIHPKAINESEDIGENTNIWAFSHIMKGAKIGSHCNIGDHTYVEGKAVIGNGVTIKNGVCIWDGVTLNDYVFIGPNAVFANDKVPRSSRNPLIQSKYANNNWLAHTKVLTGASIGGNATILCGIEIGEYALDGAGATVTQNVPAYCIVTGNPAKKVGYICICGMKLEVISHPVCSKCNRKYCETKDRNDGTIAECSLEFLQK